MKRTAVVTGGAGGIGRCLVETLADAGMAVVFIDVDPERLSRTEAQMKMRGFDVDGFPGDVGDEAVLQAFAAFALERHSAGVDLLVNNACISRGGLLSDCSGTDFNAVLRVGLTAPYPLTRLFMKHFRPGASIVNIASSRTFMSQPDTESYTAAKGGIVALTHAMAVSLAGRVRVNCISPGWIDTGGTYDADYVAQHSASDAAQHPSGRVGTPEDIARAVLFLADARNSFINAENLVVDGGMTKLMIYHNDQGWKLHAPPSE
jgi:NAD(P)-dependent dehydrogenase (short-subunit alcohol dehydrogenase family)